MNWMCDVAFASILGRQLQPRLSFMRDMEHCVVTHIPHQYFEESGRASHEESVTLTNHYQMKETPEITTIMRTCYRL